MSCLPYNDPLLVSAVVPAFNAAATIEATILSIRRQTHARMEIIIVDDGSTDRTGEIARAHAAEDDRIRIIEIPNGGVAAARNAGIREARADLIAPIDADDLWHPHKIARQLEVMRRGGPSIGYVYTGFNQVDMDDCVIRSAAFEGCSGQVFLRSIFVNFVGNGSSLLIRREALEQIGGYSSELHRCGLQGAEDWLLQILIARRWEVGVVPARLVGYRQTPGAMSSGRLRMLLSEHMVYDLVERAHPETPSWVLDLARSSCQARLAIKHARQMDVAESVAQLVSAMAHSMPGAVAELSDHIAQVMRRRRQWIGRHFAAAGRSGADPAIRFFDTDPDTGFELRSSRYFRRMMDRVTEADRVFQLVTGDRAASVLDCNLSTSGPQTGN